MIGDIASVVGAIIGLIGFVIIIINVRSSRKAAMQAENAVLKVRVDIQRLHSVEDFSSALAAMTEIKTLHRQQIWQLLPERYSALRKSLISIRATTPDLSEDQKTTLQNAIHNFSTMEADVEKFLADGSESPDVARFNIAVSRQFDRLQQILVEIKQHIGR